MTVQLPYDVVGEVINHLSDDRLSLCVCSLICKATVPLCQRYIFSSIYLPDFQQVRRFAKLLETSPKIADHVRILWIKLGDLTKEGGAVKCCQQLLKISRLHTLNLEFEHYSWKQLICQEDLDPVLFHLLSLPRLSTLEINCEPYQFPYVYVTRCHNLEALVLNSIDLESPWPDEMDTSFVGPPLESLQLHDFALGRLDVLKQYMEKHFLNLSRLKTLEIDAPLKEEKEVFQDIIQSCAPTLQSLTCSSRALCPLQLGGMPGLPFLKIFNLTLYWETARVEDWRFWLRTLENHHVTNTEIEVLSNVLSDCPELNEINVSIRFGRTDIGEARQFFNGKASDIDREGCLKMCRVMDKSFSRLQSDTIRLISFTFNMKELGTEGDEVIVRRFFPFLSARGILRVSAIV